MGIAFNTDRSADYRAIIAAARKLYESQPDWVTFFREVLGVDGIVRRKFQRLEDLVAFEKSTEFEQIQKWLVKLRELRNATDTESEPTRVITIRLPKSMHEYLRTEAHDLRTSMNKLCISKLLQVVEEDLIPRDERHEVERDSLRRGQDSHQLEDLRRQISALQSRLVEYDNYLVQGSSR